jgi:branched-chain amino acid transport system permease protein
MIKVQIFFNSIVGCALLMLISISFYVSYRVVSVFHFSHAITISLGAYFAFLMTHLLKMPLIVTFALAILLSAGVGYLIEIGCYRYLRKKKSKPLIYILASLGIYTILQNLISIFWGDNTKSIYPDFANEGLNVLDARVTPIQIAIVFSAIIVICIVFLFFKYSNLGKAMRVVASDTELAKISGIDTDRVISWAFVLGSSLGALAGILLALDTNMTPVMGMHPFMMGVVVMIIGGQKHIFGIVLGALLLSFSQQYCAYYGRSEWQDGIAFTILLIFLLLKPEGFFGKKLERSNL